MRKVTIRNSILLVVFMLFFPASVFALNPGDRAPSFATESSQGELSLADYSGRKHVVLALYFAVFSSV